MQHNDWTIALKLSQSVAYASLGDDFSKFQTQWLDVVLYFPVMEYEEDISLTLFGRWDVCNGIKVFFFFKIYQKVHRWQHTIRNIYDLCLCMMNESDCSHYFTNIMFQYLSNSLALAMAPWPSPVIFQIFAVVPFRIMQHPTFFSATDKANENHENHHWPRYLQLQPRQSHPPPATPLLSSSTPTVASSPAHPLQKTPSVTAPTSPAHPHCWRYRLRNAQHLPQTASLAAATPKISSSSARSIAQRSNIFSHIITWAPRCKQLHHWQPQHRPLTPVIDALNTFNHIIPYTLHCRRVHLRNSIRIHSTPFTDKFNTENLTSPVHHIADKFFTATSFRRLLIHIFPHITDIFTADSAIAYQSIPTFYCQRLRLSTITIITCRHLLPSSSKRCRSAYILNNSYARHTASKTFPAMKHCRIELSFALTIITIS